MTEIMVLRNIIDNQGINFPAHGFAISTCDNRNSNSVQLYLYFSIDHAVASGDIDYESVHQFVLAPTWSTAKLIAWHRAALAIVLMVL